MKNSRKVIGLKRLGNAKNEIITTPCEITLGTLMCLTARQKEMSYRPIETAVELI